jgi:hypothetical protein
VREHHRPEGKQLSRLVVRLAVWELTAFFGLAAFLRWVRAPVGGFTPAERIAKRRPVRSYGEVCRLPP